MGMKKFLWAICPLVVMPTLALAQFDADAAKKQDAAKAPEMSMMDMKSMKGSPELKKLSGMVGSFKTSGKSWEGGKEMSVNGSCTTMWGVGDAWLESNEIMHMGSGKGAMTLHGHLMISYDSMSTMYNGYWMDDMMGTATAMKGNFEGEKLVMKSDAMGMMPAMTYMMEPTKGGGNHFVATMADGKPALDITYTRVHAAPKKKKVKKAAPKKMVAKPATGTTMPPPSTGTTKAGGF